MLDGLRITTTRAAFVCRGLTLILALAGFAFIGAAVTSPAHASLPETDEEPTDDPNEGGGSGLNVCQCDEDNSPCLKSTMFCADNEEKVCCEKPWPAQCYTKVSGGPPPPGCF